VLRAADRVLKVHWKVVGLQDLPMMSEALALEKIAILFF
jgi:hypothetical protein